MLAQRLVAAGLLAGCLAAPASAALGERVLARADAPTPAPAVTATPDPYIARARGEFDAWTAGKLDRRHYTPEANTVFTDAVIAQVSAQLAALGPVQSFTQRYKTTGAGATIITYRIACMKPPVLDLRISWDAHDTIDGIAFHRADT